MHTTAAVNRFWGRLARALAMALVTGLCFSGAASAATRPATQVPEVAPAALPAAPGTISPATAAQLAAAMDVAPGDLVSADLMGSDPLGVGVANAQVGNFFPTHGSTFAILSTGLASDASRPNSEGNLSTELGGLNNNEGNDLVRLHMQLHVPANVNCANFDFSFYSEEFPEWVGYQYNDAFTAQLNNPAISVSHTLTDSIVIAPGNFALDSAGNVISVNTVFGVSAPTGTTYDGVTPFLQARAVVTPSTTIDMYLSIQDLGDSIYDSAVFLDHFHWSQDNKCSSGTLSAGRVFMPFVQR
jgi:hypothetical protein